MRDLIESALKGQKADYIEIRIEETESTNISFRGRELDGINHSTGKGGNVRACTNGGWGFASFNDIESIDSKIEQAVNQAKMVGNGKTQLADILPVIDIVPPYIVSDPTNVPLAEKHRILEGYLDLLWGGPEIQTSTLRYSDGHRRLFYGNNQGTYTEQSRIDVNFNASAIARSGGDLQQASISMGSLGNFDLIHQLQNEVAELPQKAVDFLAAPQVTGGEYTVILDPILAGVFVHEAFGHLSEADHVYENSNLREVMVLGRRFGGKHLNIVDGAKIPGLRGSFRYDEEGMEAQRTDLIREGMLVGRLHSRETAAMMNELPSGNARAISYHHPPIVRMTNTIIEPGDATLDDLLEGVKEGVYCKNWYGGMTSMEQFTFSAGETYMIRNGRIEEAVRPVMLSGNVFSTLENLDGVANDLVMNEGGGCGKNGQSPLPVSNGSPHIRLRKCLVGGA
ncbi:MAG: TldD/PmbA family protein [Chloroflexota bacterium]|nr:TldD/PmbA family protein [Chloroflexota bacterium]